MNSQSNEKNMDMNRTNQSTPNIRWMLVGYDLVVYAVVAIILLKNNHNMERYKRGNYICLKRTIILKNLNQRFG